MAFTEGNSHAVSNSTTPVTLVAGPRDPVRRVVKMVTIYNAHSGSVEAILRFKDGATTRVLWRGTLATLTHKELPENGGVYVLDSAAESLEVVLTSSPATQSDLTAHWGDSS